MVDISDITKLRPDLPKISDAELERISTEIAMEKERRAVEARRATVQAIVEQANDHQEAIIAGLRFLAEHKLLSEEVKASFTSTTGSFSPHLRFKTVDADRVIARMDEKNDEGKKIRRPRKPKD